MADTFRLKRKPVEKDKHGCEKEKCEKPKKVYIQQEQLPRNIEIQTMQFPKNTKYKTVAYPNYEAMGFRYDSYNHPYNELLKSKVSEEQFNKTLREASQICGKLWSKSRVKSLEDPFAIKKKMLVYLIPFTLLSLLLFVLRIYESASYNNDTMVIFATLLQLLVVVGVVLIFAYSFLAKYKPEDLEGDIQSALQKHFEKANQSEVYKSQGLTWEISDRFFYVELSIDHHNHTYQ